MNNDLTPRQLFRSAMRGEKTPRRFVWNWNFGQFAGGGSEFWQATVERWYGEGLPRSIDTAEKINAYFGTDPYILRWNVDPMPLPPEQILSRDERSETVRTGMGREVVRRFAGTGKESSMEEHIAFPLQSREDWKPFKSALLDPEFPRRYTMLQPEFSQMYQRGGVGGLACGSLYGWLRNWFGIEELAYKLYDEPELIQEMLEDMTEFFIGVLQRTAKVLPPEQLQFFHFWEDMAANTGPLISPVQYRQFMQPCYTRIVQAAKALYPDAVFTLDSDGNVTTLIDIWLESGITCIFPAEVAAGMDVCELKRRYGNDLQIIGGVDKRELAKGPDAIRREVERILPAYEMGGYLPDVDHSVPPDISFENYCFYKELLDSSCRR